jgi:hypothetical protein
MSSSEKSRRQGHAIRAVPPNRLLAESDLHRDDVLVGTYGRGLFYVNLTSPWR